jgi:hypothetical protein
MGREMNTDTPVPPVPGWQEPLVFDLNNEQDVPALNELLAQKKVRFVSDKIRSAIEELYHIENPSQIDSLDKEAFDNYLKSFGNGRLGHYGVWVYYPWNATLVHFPPPEDLARLRGSRNRNLISEDERKVLKQDKTIVIFGLSVGSNAVDSLLMQGIGSQLVLVDMDQLDPTNLNRIRAAYDQVGIHKVDIVAKKISELDPFLEQVHYREGVDEGTLAEILAKYQPAIIIDEIDSLRMKILIRQSARQHKIPVLMATDDGDDILLDIERFDLSDAPILHGLLPQEVIDQILANEKMDRRQMGAIIGKYFVNLENVPLRMLESLLEVGKTLPSWPQLGGAAVLSGLYLAYGARKILLGQPLNPGRFVMGPEAQLNPDVRTEEYKRKKAELIKKMMQGQ